MVLEISEFVKQVKTEKISVVEYTEQILEEIKEHNPELNHFNLVAEELALKQAEEIEAGIKTGRHNGRLLGVPISVKDCICVKGVESRAGSKILSNYIPTFDATVIAKAKAEGAIIIGKTSQDEFGFGSFSVNTGLGFSTPKNPHDKNRCCGGSSGGSAGFTAFTQFAHASIAESTGGSIACPASFCGVVGFTPTYGRVSRYGLIDYANSLDKIGTMGKTVGDAALLLEMISGRDLNDSTSLPETVSKMSDAKEEAKGLKVGIIKDFVGEGIDEAVKKAVYKSADELKKKGAKVEQVSLPLNAKYEIPTYYIIAMSEASTNLARYCGMRYGLHEKLEGTFDEYFTKVRSKGFGKEAKRRIILGTFARMSGFRDAYYLRAMKIRTKLIEEYKKAFKKFDVLLSPVMPTVAPKFSDIEKLTPLQHYYSDVMVGPPNLAGLPHLTLKVGEKKKMPIGVLLTANHLEEKKLVKAGLALEEGK